MMEAAAHSSSARAETTTQWAELTSMLEEMEVRQQRGNDAEKAESQADGEEGGGSMVGPHQLSSWRRKRQAHHFAAPPLAATTRGGATPPRPATIAVDSEPKVEAKTLPTPKTRTRSGDYTLTARERAIREKVEEQQENEDDKQRKRTKKEKKEKKERKKSSNGSSSSKEEREKLVKVRKDSKNLEREEKRKRKEEEKTRKKEEKQKEKEREADVAPGSVVLRYAAARKATKSADDLAGVVQVTTATTTSSAAGKPFSHSSPVALRRARSASSGTDPGQISPASDRENALSRSGTISRVEVRRKPTTGVSTTATQPVGDDPLLVTRLVIAFLIDAFVRFHGNERHGVFRVPGDADEVSRTKERLDRGEFVLTTTDSFVVASVLIAWLAELPEPLIPFAHYDACIEIATRRGLGNRGESSKEEFKLVARLPELNKSVIFDLLDFIKELAKPHTIEKTAMPLSSLAMVFQPVFLRSQDPSALFLNSAYEASFVRQLFSTYLALSD
ncbi:RhoGAP domain containing protein [Acanthamoeba castellanii str. Neff]|uniref:RhoGAP domain containing protein n=1 Tax=Acanthamoeba castellanii (strain ATCC 30010 / Neff) TaxID=1257118 RepID=L8GPL1_ACACF|nr:RhoGAP domain containing protein [Acanthamoeba castellanii str. Neff]ELR14867.1 RhoGAP domain containing protein [Acanthamoeba castellanii str. Neff]